MSSYITAMGRFLPGDPIPNERVDDYIGAIGSNSTAVRDRVIKGSGIHTRHYGIGTDQKSTVTAAQMAASAIRGALQRGGVGEEEIDLLAAASTVPDVIAPGIASMVHGELGNPPCEIISTHGICCSGMMALKAAHLQVLADGKRHAIACATEFPSRILKSSWLASSLDLDHQEGFTLDGAFVRYILSDGAGAALLQDRPRAEGLSLRIDWIRLRSYANVDDPCMYYGKRNPKATKGWSDYATPEEAAADGALALRQDVGRLPHLVKVCADEFEQIVEEGLLDPSKPRYGAMHYSAEVMRSGALREIARRGFDAREDGWYSNLPSVGNVGCAAIYLILEDIFYEKELDPGDQIMCMIPESGRYAIAYMLLTAVGPDDA
jgi:3-oxoacyl-[acyl-carrier-protein] synthase III